MNDAERQAQAWRRQAEDERDAALARADKYAADLLDEQREHTEALAKLAEEQRAHGVTMSERDAAQAAAIEDAAKLAEVTRLLARQTVPPRVREILSETVSGSALSSVVVPLGYESDSALREFGRLCVVRARENPREPDLQAVYAVLRGER